MTTPNDGTDTPAEAEADQQPPDDQPEQAVTPEDDDTPLGPAGEKALKALKEERRQLRDELRQMREELQALKDEKLPEEERKIEEARREARAEAERGLAERLFKAELKAATVGKLNDVAANDLLADPSFALKALGLNEVPVTDDGDVDGEAISQAVASYLEARPFLAVDGATPKPPAPIDQGARGAPASEPTIDEQIAAAEKAGNHKLSMQLKLRKYEQAA